jgi:serine/threonine protein kinase
MGAVQLARDQRLQRLVVIKLVPSQVAGVLVREANVLARLSHANIIQVYDVGQLSDGSGYLVMAYVEGATLAEHLQSANRDDSSDLRKLLEMFVVVCRALAFAHCCGVVHGDVKPANILVSSQGHVVISDWSLAKLMEDSAQEEYPPVAAAATMAGNITGTPAYLAPEQVSGDLASIGPRTDIYALGNILFETLTGQSANMTGGRSLVEILSHVLNSPPPRARSINRLVPEALDAVCTKALARKPEERYASADLLADEVQRWLDGKDVRHAFSSVKNAVSRWLSGRARQIS